MHPPPGLTPTTEPRVEQISAASDTALATRTQQMRYLVHELGVTRPQAHALIKAYEADLERPLVTAGRTHRPTFIRWLMEQSPGGRGRSVPTWRVGEGPWRTS